MKGVWVGPAGMQGALSSVLTRKVLIFRGKKHVLGLLCAKHRAA